MKDEHGWTVVDETASEMELQGLLFALVRMLKPGLVVETGCYRGFATQQLGLAVKRNREVVRTFGDASTKISGQVVSCDVNQEYIDEALRRTRELPVEIRNCRGIDLPELREADFVFCDSDYPCRAGELELVKRGAVVLIHDTRISYHSDHEPLEGLVRSLGGICFDSHRGWGLLRKGSLDADRTMRLAVEAELRAEIERWRIEPRQSVFVSVENAADQMLGVVSKVLRFGKGGRSDA